MKKVYLHDGWSVLGAGIEGRLGATVPGCLHTDLMKAGVIKDIFYRDNNEKYGWVENCEPVYETRFDAKIGANVTLKLEGIDTFASLYLNGKHLGDTHNMFIPHSFDVTDVLRERNNHLVVRFTPPLKAVEGMPEPPKGYAFTGDRVNARRMQCTYSWDWVARFVTMGIFRPVYLEYRDGLEIEDVYVRTDAIDSFGAALTAEYTFSGINTPAVVEAELVSPSGEVVYTDRFYADRPLMVRKMDIESPELWYPNGYGDQPLYTLRAKTGNSEWSGRIGIKTLRIVNIIDKNGSEYHEKSLHAAKTSYAGERTHNDSFFGFKVIVNGIEIFCQGGNWVPCDPFPSEESDEKIRSLVYSAKDMGVNMLRVWGGGLFEKASFYDACDECGILFCHDFLMACAKYPEEEDWFINELLLESEFAVKYLRNHPSLAWFHGDNENAEQGSDTLPDYTGRRSYLLGAFPNIYKYSRNIPILASSPWGGDRFSSITSGTSHNTNFLGETFRYMYEEDCKNYKEFLAQFTSRFVSEEPSFGAICRESMLEFMTEEDIIGEDESILKHHAKTNPGLPTHIYDDNRAFAEKVLGKFESGEDRYFKMKYIQCEWVRLTVELAKRNLGYTNGIIFWMFNDCWPASVGWAFVDYYCRRKPSYYSFKRLSLDVIGSVDLDSHSFVVSNTASAPKAAEVRIHLLDLADGMSEIGLVTKTVGLDAYSSLCIDISDKLDSTTFALCEVECEGAIYRSFYKDGDLAVRRQDSFDILEKTDTEITIRANGYLQAVELEGDYLFSDNYFTMLDGEIKTVTLERFGNKPSELSVKSYVIK